MMTNNKSKHLVKPITASELLEIGAKDIGKIKELLDKGTPIKLDEKTADIIKKDLNALPKVALEKIQIFAKEIGVDLDKPGFADASQMTGYISGLMDASDSTAFSTLQSEFTQSSSISDQGTSSAFAIGVIYVLVVILFVLLVLLGLKTALTGRPGSGSGGSGSTPNWWNTIIHGPNDPNGPIGPGPQS